MSALTTEGMAIWEKWSRYQFRLASGVKAYKGGQALGIAGVGWVEPGTNSGIGSGDLWVGTFAENVDNTAGSSTVVVNVDFLEEKTIVWRVNDGSITPTDLFSIAYVDDDATVTKTSSGRAIAGAIFAVDAHRGVAVEVSRSLRIGSAATGPASGDLSGNYPSPTVAKVNGASIPAAGALTPGNVLQVSGVSATTYAPVNLAGGTGYVTGALPAGNQSAQTMGGDVSGTTAAAVVAAVNGATYPAGGSLVTGQVPRVTGASSVAYGAVNLSNSNAVTGTLPSGNQASQTMGGDCSGNTAACVVGAVNGTTFPAGGSLTTGQVPRVTGAGSVAYGALNLANASAVTGTLPASNQAAQTMGGSCGGTTAAATVVQFDGSGAGGTGNVLPAQLTFNSSFSNKGIFKWDGGSTSDATQTKLAQFVLTDNRLTCFEARFVGHNRSNGDSVALTITFAAERHSGGNANAIASQTKTDIARSSGASGWTADLIISGATVGYWVTGAAATSISWSVSFDIIEGG